MLLRCIVRVDEPKLMCRLRSRHAKKSRKTSNRRSPLIHLREALNDSSVHATRAVTETDLDKIRTEAQHLESLFMQFESMAYTEATINRRIDKLIDIVKATESFALKSLSKMVGALDTSRVLDPSTKGYLPVAIEKLARYSLASRYLIATARIKRYSIFTHVNVEVISIRRANEPLFQGPWSNLEQASQNAINANVPAKKRRTLLPIRSFLGQSYDNKAQDFQARVCSESEAWKVHAEIQLLAYHALNPQEPKPRIIASSKSACYLCNLFVGLHGQFHVPRTHGRIYDRWLFPDWLDFPAEERTRLDVVLSQFNGRIEQTIVNVLRTRKLSHNHPNESVVFPVRPLSESTLSVVQLATALPTPPGSQISLAAQMMQVRSAHTTQVSIVPMDIIEGGRLTRSSTSEAASAEKEKSVKQAEALPISGNGHTKDPSSLSRTSVSKEQDVEENSDRTTTEAGAKAPSLQEGYPTPSLPHPILEDLNQEEHARDSLPQSPHRHLLESNPAPIATTSTSTELSEYTLIHSGQAVSHHLTSPTSEMFVKTGKLHLTLSRDGQVPPPLDLQPPAEHTIMVKRLDAEAQHRLATFNQLGEVINAQDMAPGEAITVDRGGWLSEHDLVISGGAGITVAIRYGTGALQD